MNDDVNKNGEVSDSLRRKFMSELSSWWRDFQFFLHEAEKLHEQDQRPVRPAHARLIGFAQVPTAVTVYDVGNNVSGHWVMHPSYAKRYLKR